MPESWVSELIKRYTEDKDQRYVRRKPIGFEYERDPFDPSGYYRELTNVKEISRAGTSLLNQRLANQRAIEAQKYQQSLMQGAPGQVQSPGQISYGSGKMLKGGKGRFGLPLARINVTSGYGHRAPPTRGATGFHNGIDLGAPAGTPIYATHDGVVGSAGWNDGYGWNVTLNAGNGVRTFYGHQSRLNVRSGQRVRRGQVIGWVGSTGVSTGPHLHYGVQVNGQWINPAGYL